MRAKLSVREVQVEEPVHSFGPVNRSFLSLYPRNGKKLNCNMLIQLKLVYMRKNYSARC